MFPAFTQYNIGKPTVPPSATATQANLTNYMSGTAGTSQAAFWPTSMREPCRLVSWIFPTAQATEHPGDGSINNGPQYYEPIITALMASPSWANTVLMITYDENDGYFDHVPPPQAPVGTPGEFLKGPAFGASGASTDPTTGKTTYSNDPSNGITGPVGLGFRVPTSSSALGAPVAGSTPSSSTTPPASSWWRRCSACPRKGSSRTGAITSSAI